MDSGWPEIPADTHYGHQKGSHGKPSEHLHSTLQFEKFLPSQEADRGGRVAFIIPASQRKKQLLTIWPGP